MNYKVRAAAERDMDDAASWYREHSLDPRLPLRFLLEVRTVFETIVEAPYSYLTIHRDIRRCRVLAFPAYSVFFRIVGGDVIILAVWHGKRRPHSWKRRR